MVLCPLGFFFFFFCTESVYEKVKLKRGKRERQKVEKRKRREAIRRKTKWRDQVKENQSESK